MPKVHKTTPEAEQREKDEAFLRLKPEERLRIMREIRDRWRDPLKTYKLEGSRVTISRRP